MDRVLLLMTTTTYKAAAFLDAARALGADVVVASERSPALGGHVPGAVLAFPFADVVAATQQVRTAAATAPFTAVIAADDDGVVLAAHVAQALGLAHNSVAAVSTACDKRSTRRALRDAGLPVPGFRSFGVDLDPRRVAADVDYPCVLKPVALSGSRGVIRANDETAFVVAFERIAAILSSPDLRGRTDSREILVEDYIPGVELALEGLLENGVLRTLALFDKPDPLVGPFFQETLYVTPSRLPGATQAQVEASVQRAVEAIGLRHGPLHAEVRCNPNGVFLLEAAPRSIGGLCARALRFGAAGAASLEELLLAAALGRDTTSLGRETSAAGVMMIPIPRAGVLHQVEGVAAARSVPHVDDVRITATRGQPLLPPPEGGRYLGFLFARAPTPEAVEAALRQSHARLVLDIRPLDDDTWNAGRPPSPPRRRKPG